MSDLKDLAWSVQEKVDAVPFEHLERRGVRRRHRRRALVAAAAASVVVLAAVLPWGSQLNGEEPPIAPSVAPLPQGSDPGGEALVRSATADISMVKIASPTRWAATWSDCKSWCTYAAVLSRDGVKATAPVRSMYYNTLQLGDEVMAVAGPEGEKLSADDPTWSKSVLFRLTDDGPKQSVLRYVEPSSTFHSGEVLINSIAEGRLVVLNPDESTVRPLELPGVEMAWTPTRDSTGRWWIVGGQLGNTARSDIYWTDDGGKHWNQSLLDPDNPGMALAVSPNGRTIVATSFVEPKEQIATMKLSTDRGATWTTVTTPPWVRAAGPVVFDDGTVMMIGKTEADPVDVLHRIVDGQVLPVEGTRDRLYDLETDGSLLYGIANEDPINKRVATSTDRGKTWQFFEPR